MQEKLNFNQELDEDFRDTFDLNGRECNLTRKNGITVVSIGNINFAGRQMGTLFTTSNHHGYSKNYFEKRLGDLTHQELRSFVMNFVLEYEETVTVDNKWSLIHIIREKCVEKLLSDRKK